LTSRERTTQSAETIHQVSAPRFGISTHLYHDQRLSREHLASIARQGFDSIEVFATRTHFDYHDASAVAELKGWLHETGLQLHSIHAPIVLSLTNGQWGPPFSNAIADEAERERAIRETDAALNLARQIETRYLVVHLGTPDAQHPPPGDNNLAPARRSVEQIVALANPLGIDVALEVIPNGLSDAASLVNLIENDLELPRLGICMDFGHAFLQGDPVEAIETASGHLVTTHIHDSDGRQDAHLMPYDGSIDWSSVLTAMQKVGYESTWMFEVANTSSPATVLQQAVQVRQRFQEILR
jgi:sugar phosphate isomerase/epimerase